MNLELFKSLRHKNYRLFFTAQLISVTGTWLQLTAMPWLVYRLSSSALLLGLVGFLSQISILLFSPIAGAVADHYPRKKLLILTQTLAMAQALLLAALVLSGTVRIWHIVALATFSGIVNAFDMPTRQAFVIEMVGKEDLRNAIAMNSMIFNGARLVGPAAAGILIAAFGEGVCFLVNAVSYLGVIAALAVIRVQGTPRATLQEHSISRKLLMGVAYIRRSRRVANVLLLLSVMGLVAVFPMVLMPVFARDVFGLGAKGLGVFMSAVGVGALIGTLRLASMRDETGLEKHIVRSAVLFGVFLTAFALAGNVFVAVPLLALAGYFMVLQMALSNTHLQLMIPDAMRGRVMGFFTVAFMGFAPLGSLAAGFIAHRVSAPFSVALGGMACFTFALLFGGKLNAGE